MEPCWHCWSGTNGAVSLHISLVSWQCLSMELIPPNHWTWHVYCKYTSKSSPRPGSWIFMPNAHRSNAIVSVVNWKILLCLLSLKRCGLVTRMSYSHLRTYCDKKYYRHMWQLHCSKYLLKCWRFVQVSRRSSLKRYCYKGYFYDVGSTNTEQHRSTFALKAT